MDVRKFSINILSQIKSELSPLIRTRKEREKNYFQIIIFFPETAPHLLKGLLSFVESNLEDGDPLGCFV